MKAKYISYFNVPYHKRGTWVEDNKEVLNGLGISASQHNEYYVYINNIYRSFNTIDFDRKLYNLGMRNPTALENAESINFWWKKARLGLKLPWLDAFAEEFATKYTNLKALNSAFLKAYRIRGAFVQTDTGFCADYLLVNAHIWIDGSFQYKFINKSLLETNYRYVGYKNCYVLNDSPTYYINGRTFELPEIFGEDFDYCEEHDNFFLASGNCRQCLTKYTLKSYTTNILNETKKEDQFKQLDFEKKPPMVGIELEFDTKLHHLKTILKAYPNYLIGKQDGSIDGYEIVTVPASIAYHKEQLKTFPWQDQVVTRKNGVHIHVDQKALSLLQVGKLMEFIYNDHNARFINTISGRPFNHYCSTSTKKTYWSSIDTYSPIPALKQENNHGTAVNISKHKTIEFRFFAGTNNYETLCRYLDFLESLLKFTAPGATNYSLPSLRLYETYKDWLAMQYEYKRLFAFIQSENI